MEVCDRKEGRVLVLGHRGAPEERKENTVPSFLRAIELGADGVELDIRVTKDNVLVVSHDNNLKRVWGRDILVEETEYSALKEAVPELATLPEVFDALGAVHYDIEIKADKPLGFRKEVVYLLKEELDRRPELEDKVMLSSFNPVAMRLAGKIFKRRFPLAVIYDGPPTSVPPFLRHGEGRILFRCSFLKPKWDIAEEEKRRKPGWTIVPWTVDTEEGVKRMLALSVPAIITNRPDLVLRTLRKDRRR